jgi:hypothetical protein
VTDLYATDTLAAIAFISNLLPHSFGARKKLTTSADGGIESHSLRSPRLGIASPLRCVGVE